MKRCNAMVDAGRRQFLAGAGFAAAGEAAATVMTTQAKAAQGAARVPDSLGQVIKSYSKATITDFPR
jgi:hypothetical protein